MAGRWWGEGGGGALQVMCVFNSFQFGSKVVFTQGREGEKNTHKCNDKRLCHALRS